MRQPWPHTPDTPVILEFSTPMSTPLPDDLNQWPADPYQLLGLAPGASAAEARRSYTRLIRQFKPEQFPEHFRRIRDAYEVVKLFATYSLDPPSEPPQVDAEVAPQTAAQSPIDHDNLDQILPLDVAAADPHRLASLPRNDAWALLWQRAVRGELPQAYRGLGELAERPDCAVESCVRLYWLLRIAPELDPTRSPCDWLVHGLRCGGWHHTGYELYRREVEHRPAEALTERFESLLEAQAPLFTIAEWLRWRWQAAGRLGKPQVIWQDVKAMRPRFANSLDDEPWGRLLLEAVDQLAWFTGRDAERAVAEYCEEIERTVHLHGRLDLHRLDVLSDLTSAWKQLCVLGTMPSCLRDLLPASWTRSAAELREPVRVALLPILQAPEQGCEMLDALKSDGPLVFAQLANLIDRIVWESPAPQQPCQPSNLEPCAARFAAEAVNSAVDPPRWPFLRFCLDHGVLPSEALDAMKDFPSAHVADLLRADEVIRVICVASRWFWG